MSYSLVCVFLSIEKGDVAITSPLIWRGRGRRKQKSRGGEQFILDMVKLAAVRSNRTYGPRGREGLFEFLNGVVYLIATLMLLGGLILLLPGFRLQNHPYAPLIILSIGLCLVILVNVHDLFAQAVGINFHLRFLTYDPQLAFVEFGAPIFHIIGGVLLLIATITLLKVGSLY